MSGRAVSILRLFTCSLQLVSFFLVFQPRKALDMHSPGQAPKSNTRKKKRAFLRKISYSLLRAGRSWKIPSGRLPPKSLTSMCRVSMAVRSRNTPSGSVVRELRPRSRKMMLSLPAASKHAVRSPASTSASVISHSERFLARVT